MRNKKLQKRERVSQQKHTFFYGRWTWAPLSKIPGSAHVGKNYVKLCFGYY